MRKTWLQTAIETLFSTIKPYLGIGKIEDEPYDGSPVVRRNIEQIVRKHQQA